MEIQVKTYRRPGTYKIIIRRGIINHLGEIIQPILNGGELVVLTNHKVKRLWLKKVAAILKKNAVKYHIISIPDGEKYKGLETYQKILSRLTSLKIDRYAMLMTLGGGVIGDLGGCVAATYKRGLKLIHCPTTVIAQIDASIGGKVAIDLPEGKNLVGSFYNPEAVITDPETLTTLSRKEFINGLFEAVKIGLVKNPGLYEFIQKNFDGIMNLNKKSIDKIVYQSARTKVEVVEKDPYDHGHRMILNFGHTFGHALETHGAYNTISHGRAVGWGMLLSFHLSELSGLCDPEYFGSASGLIRKLLKNSRLTKSDPQQLWNIMGQDKKARNNRVRFVLLRRIGEPVLKEISRSQFMEAMEKL